MPSTRQRSARIEASHSLHGVRLGPILRFPQVISAAGGNADAVLQQAGIDPALFADPESRISAEALGRLCQLAVSSTGCAHIGLLLGTQFRLSDLGDLGFLMRHSPSVGDACRSLTLHLHLQDRVAVPLLFAPKPGSTALGYSVLNYHTLASDLIQDGTLAILWSLLHELCGPGWKPLHVQFAHSKPADVKPFRELFGCALQFDAQVSAVVFSSKWLAQPLMDADPRLYAVLSERFAQTAQGLAGPLADTVRRVLHSMVLSGTTSIDGVATFCRLSERSLRRRLVEEGTSYQELLNATLLALAQQLMSETHLSVSEIAAALHYRNLASFSSAFSRWTQMSPSRWRQQQADRKQAGRNT